MAAVRRRRPPRVRAGSGARPRPACAGLRRHRSVSRRPRRPGLRRRGRTAPLAPSASAGRARCDRGRSPRCGGSPGPPSGRLDGRRPRGAVGGVWRQRPRGLPRDELGSAAQAGEQVFRGRQDRQLPDQLTGAVRTDRPAGRVGALSGPRALDYRVAHGIRTERLGPMPGSVAQPPGRSSEGTVV